MSPRLVESHHDPVRAVHVNQFAPRQSHLSIGYFDRSRWGYVIAGIWFVLALTGFAVWWIVR